MSGHAELVRGRIVERRQDLAAHNGAALDLVARVLAAMHDAAYGQIPSIRCDRQVRYRGMQLAGEKALPLEDLCAVQLEGATGQAVALAELRIRAAAAGYALTPLEGQASGDVHECLAQLIEQSSTVAAGLSRALEDRVFAPDEAVDLSPKIQRLKEAVASLEAVTDERARTGRTACR